MIFKYYSLAQAQQRLSAIIQPLILDKRSILDLIRKKQLNPYIWYDGYVGVPREDEVVNINDYTIEIFDNIKGYLKLDSEKHLANIQGLLLNRCSQIFVTEIAEFSDLESGNTAAAMLSRHGVLFSKNITAEKKVTLPIKVKDLSQYFLTPGIRVHKGDIYFLAEDIENLNQIITPRIGENKLKPVSDVNSDLEAKPQIDQENISSTSLSVLDKDHEDFAPYIVVGIALNQYISQQRSAFIAACRESNAGLQFNREQYVEEFFSRHNIAGLKERERLKVISNTLMSGKSSPELQKLAKSIKLF